MTEVTRLEEAVLPMLHALKAILLLRLREEQPESERGSIEGLLFKAGYSNKEIVEMTGAAKSTVSTRLKAEGLR